MKKRTALLLIVCMLASMLPAALGEDAPQIPDYEDIAIQLDDEILISDEDFVTLDMDEINGLQTEALDLSQVADERALEETESGDGSTGELMLDTQAGDEAQTASDPAAVQKTESSGQDADAEKEGLVLPEETEIILPDESLDGAPGEDEAADPDNPDFGDIDNSALLDGYLRRVLPGLGSAESNKWARTGRQNLVNKNLKGSIKLYDLLKNKVKDVAAGKTASTVFKFSDKQLGLTNSWWTAKDLGGSSLSDSKYREALLKKEGYDEVNLRFALWVDYPYELFWFDRSRPSTFNCEVEYEKNNGKVVKARLTNVSYSMRIVREYAASDFRISKLPKQINAAASNIKKIVSKYKGLDDYKKLKAYADEICRMVNWGKGKEDESASSFEQSLLPVFDGNKSTDTVCSGFSRAFKYLVDISTFKGNVACEVIRGQVLGHNHGPSHAWNVVSMPDGRYYLVDTSGGDRDDGCADEMFMKGCIGENGYPYVCDSRNYILKDDDFEKFYGSNSPWMKLSNGDYGKDYRVNISAKNGSLAATPEVAAPGATITLKATPSLGCKNATPTVKFGSKKISLKKVNSTTWTFKMPSGEASAQIEFAPKSKNWHTINGIGDLRGGTVTANVDGKKTEGADKGKKVSLVLTPDKGYDVKTPKLMQNGKKVSLKSAGKNTWSFVMPAGEVELAEPFKVDAAWEALQKKINNAKNGAVIKLTRNLTAGSGNVGLSIPKNKKITLDLAGHTLDRGLDDPAPMGYVIEVLGALTIKDSSSKKTGTITGGYNAEHGGAIVVCEGAGLTLQGGTLAGNKSAYGGGGVYVCPKGVFEMNGGTITGSVGRVFGTVYVDHSTFKMNGGAITGSTVLGESCGGGVYVGDSSLTMTGGTVSNNKAKYGGGLYLDRSSFTMSGGAVSNNTSEIYGGGVCVYSNDCTITGGTVSGNTSGDSGGGIIVTRGTFNLSGGTVSGNTAQGSSYGYGGGVYVADGSLSISGATIDSNDAIAGGGVYVRQSGFSMIGGTISNNRTSKGGGGLTVAGTDSAMTGGAITGNTSGDNGGGICIVDGAFSLNGGTVSGNSASGGSFGGGVYVTRGSLSLNGATVSNNTAERGGGVYMQTSDFTMNSGAISGNISRTFGGGLAMKDRTVTLNGGAITGNSCSDNGGGICVYDGNLNLTGGTVSGNTSSLSGGGVYLSRGDFRLDGGSISANSAATGGGVFVYQCALAMTGGSITGNTATDTAGGVYYSNSGFTLSGSPVISDNTCTAYGGSVAQDVYMYSTDIIDIGGGLTDQARVGVFSTKRHVFTRGLGRSGNIGAFFSDDAGSAVARTQDATEAELVPAQ